MCQTETDGESDLVRRGGECLRCGSTLLYSVQDVPK